MTLLQSGQYSSISSLNKFHLLMGCARATASFALYSLGWVLLMMIGFLVVVEALRLRKPVFPLVVVGMNPLFYYCMGFLLRDVITLWLHPFTGGFAFVGDLAPVIQAIAVMAVMWMVAYWLHRHKIFFKV